MWHRASQVLLNATFNPRGAQFLDRDAASAARWFSARGLSGAEPAPAELAALLRREARIG
jgi:hypothetical protein